MLTLAQGQEIIQLLLGENFDYVELFLEDSTSHSFNNFNDERFNPDINTTCGTGIRMWKNKEITYYSIDSIAYEDIKKLVLDLKIKKSDQEFTFNKIDGSFLKNDFGSWTTSKIKDQLSEYVRIAKKVDPKIVIATSSFQTSVTNRLIINSEGKFIKKTSIYSRLITASIATDGKQKEKAYHQLSKQLNPISMFKLFNEQDNLNKIKKASKLALNLLKAQSIKSGQMPVILPHGFGAVLFHEAVGHPLEAAFISKNISQYANKIGQKVASELVTLIDDGTIKDEFGYAQYDDEGTLNQKRILIEKGILKNYLIDKYNGMLLQKEANGAGRRQNFRYPNTSRMSNTYIENGHTKVSDIIKQTKYGFYAKQLGGGQVDPYTGQFNFGVLEGYLIENGQIKNLVKGATLIGNGLDIIKKIDLVGNDFAIDPGVCGAESGMVPVTTGQPTLRISQMTVGGK